MSDTGKQNIPPSRGGIDLDRRLGGLTRNKPDEDASAQLPHAEMAEKLRAKMAKKPAFAIETQIKMVQDAIIKEAIDAFGADIFEVALANKGRERADEMANNPPFYLKGRHDLQMLVRSKIMALDIQYGLNGSLHPLANDIVNMIEAKQPLHEALPALLKNAGIDHPSLITHITDSFSTLGSRYHDAKIGRIEWMISEATWNVASTIPSNAPIHLWMNNALMVLTAKGADGIEPIIEAAQNGGATIADGIASLLKQTLLQHANPNHHDAIATFCETLGKQYQKQYMNELSGHGLLQSMAKAIVHDENHRYGAPSSLLSYRVALQERIKAREEYLLGTPVTAKNDAGRLGVIDIGMHNIKLSSIADVIREYSDSKIALLWRNSGGDPTVDAAAIRTTILSEINHALPNTPLSHAISYTRHVNKPLSAMFENIGKEIMVHAYLDPAFQSAMLIESNEIISDKLKQKGIEKSQELDSMMSELDDLRNYLNANRLQRGIMDVQDKLGNISKQASAQMLDFCRANAVPLIACGSAALILSILGANNHGISLDSPDAFVKALETSLDQNPTGFANNFNRIASTITKVAISRASGEAGIVTSSLDDIEKIAVGILTAGAVGLFSRESVIENLKSFAQGVQDQKLVKREHVLHSMRLAAGLDELDTMRADARSEAEKSGLKGSQLEKAITEILQLSPTYEGLLKKEQSLQQCSAYTSVLNGPDFLSLELITTQITHAAETQGLMGALYQKSAMHSAESAIEEAKRNQTIIEKAASTTSALARAAGNVVRGQWLNLAVAVKLYMPQPASLLGSSAADETQRAQSSPEKQRLAEAARAEQSQAPTKSTTTDTKIIQIIGFEAPHRDVNDRIA